MLRLLAVLLIILGPVGPVLANPDLRVAPRPLASAIEAMRAGRWDVATQLAARDGPAAVTLIEWHRLRAGLGTADDVTNFLSQHGDWPGLAYLRKKNEALMAEAPAADIIAFYGGTDPQSGVGALSLASAQVIVGQTDEAQATLVKAWRTLDLTTEEHKTFVTYHASLLKPHHEARMNMALWRGLKDVKQMLPLVSAQQRTLAATRNMAEKGTRGLDAQLEELPANLRHDPGVAYALFNRHLRRDQPEQAISLILAQSRHASGLGEAHRWASWRRSLARRLMRDGQAQKAYDLASVHGLTEGSSYADLEWLSGYLALTQLQAPEQALVHFQQFRAAVASPISLGRAGYWIGRAQDALGNAEAAKRAYRQGGKYQTSFYGLLAAERAGIAPPITLSGVELFPPWQEADFIQSDVYKAAVLALAMNDLNLAEQFFIHLSERLDRIGLGQMGDMLKAMEQPHLQVMLGKAAARRGIVLEGPYYALHPMKDRVLPVATELALAIARRESEFDFRVVSGAGAQGLMQLMPGTAKDVARDLSLAHNAGRVLSDWQYNAKLGSTYLAQLAERFDSNVIMIAAGYNAGPGRPIRWMDTYGDPRTTEEDMVDWIEYIPFRETRNYVMRVSESLPVYRARMGQPALPVPFSSELIGDTITSTLPTQN